MLSRGFEIETEMTIHALHRNMQVENVIIDYRDRPAGSESKLNTYSDGFRVLRTITRLYKNYRPFGFFSTLAAVLGIISLCFFGPCSGRIFCHRPSAALPYADRVCLRTGGGAFAVYFRRDPFQPADKG